MPNKSFTHKLFLILTILGITAFGLLFFHGASQAQQQSPWSEPYQFPIAGWFPDIAVDSTGMLHVAWSQSRYVYDDRITISTIIPTSTPTPTPSVTGTVQPTISATVTDPTVTSTPPPTPGSGYDVVWYSTSQDGKTWSEINDIIALGQKSLGGVEVTRPFLLIDPSGFFHMTFRDIYVYYSQVNISETHLADKWLNPYRISEDDLGYFSAIVRDHSNNLHLIYTENLPDNQCLICYHVFHRISTDNGLNWSSRTEVSAVNTGSAKPQILVDNQDNLHVIWEAGPGGTLGYVDGPVKIFYAKSTDGGATWSAPQEFTSNTQGRNPAIGMDGNNRLIVAWLNINDNRVYYTTSSNNGRLWSQPQPIENVWGEFELRQANQNGYSMTTDNGGNVHLLLTGVITETNTTLDLIHLTWNRYSWSEPDVIAAYPGGDVPEWPQGVVGNENRLHVVWHVRPADHIWDANPDYYSVWYSNRLLAGPYRKTEVYPSMTPTSTPSQTQLPPTVTPSQDLGDAPIQPGTMRIITSEADDLETIALSLIPVAAILGVFFWVARLRRRRK